MKNLAEVKDAFLPFEKIKLDTNGSMRALRINMAFADMAYDVVDLVPESHEREETLQFLLAARDSAIEALEHKYSLEKVVPKDPIQKFRKSKKS